MTSHSVCFIGEARFDDGELACFCYEDDVKKGRCDCARDGYTCTVRITVDVLKENITKQQQFPFPKYDRCATPELRVLADSLKKLSDSGKSIKKALSSLEIAAKGSRFRI